MARLAAATFLAFALVVLVMPLLGDDDYAAGTATISEGALGRFGWLQTAAFFALGAGSLLLAYVVNGSWSGRAGTIAAALVAVWGVGLVLSGIFPVDEGARGETTAAKIHLAAATLAFVVLIVAMWVASFAFRGNAAWSSWSTPSLVISAVATAALVIMAAAPQESSWGGYAQRGFVGIVLAWLTAVALVAD